MGPWRLEWLRVWRTRRLVALVATFLILGIGSAVLTYYLPELVKNNGHGIQVIVPKQTPTDSIAGFAAQIAELGTLVVVVVAAASLSIDAHPGLAAFYRTRVHRRLSLLMPRYVVATTASITALAVGTFAAWYETRVLIGPVPLGGLMIGLALEALWLCFVISVVAVFTSIVRSVLAAVGISVALLLAINLLGNLASVSSWLPTRLAASAANLVNHPAGDVWHTTAVTSAATIAALFIAVNRIGGREP